MLPNTSMGKLPQHFLEKQNAQSHHIKDSKTDWYIHIFPA